MLRKAIISAGICLSLLLLWFAVHNYRQAGPIAEENLRGLALSLSAAIDRLAVHDPSLADLAKFRPPDIAYFAMIDRHGIYRFHSNPDLIGTATGDDALERGFPGAAPTEERVTLGTGERAFQFTTPLYLPTETLVLRLTLHTYRADSVIRRAKLDAAILLGMLAVLWGLFAVLLRSARREERMQREMTRQESLARLGVMGAMLAHEIRNPLAGIKGFAQVIEKRPAEPRNSGFARNIVAEACRLEELVTELLFYASNEPPTKDAFNLGEVTSHVAAMLSDEALQLGVEMSIQVAPEVRVWGNRDRIEQVLLNLGKNALQAMPEGGTLRWSVGASGKSAVATVEDSGTGIAGNDLARVFEPFFTTKARGTGLGLALCRKIAEEHRGKIQLTSKPDEGTKVTLTLPLESSGAAHGSGR